MTATLITATQGDLDPRCCGSCNGPIGEVDTDTRMSVGAVFVPYVLITDCDDPEALIGYDLDCAVRHCGVVIEVRG
jgi:hypothetical protein